MSETRIVSILSLPDDLIQTICQLLIDSRCNAIKQVEDFESTVAKFSLSNASKDVRCLQLSCSHFLSLIDQLCLKVPVLVGGLPAKSEIERQLCRYIVDKGWCWKVNKFGIEVNCPYPGSDAIKSVDQIRPIIDNRIKLLHYAFIPNALRRFSITLPDYRNKFYSHVSEYCNDETQIIVWTPSVSGITLSQIGVPKIDACTYLDLDSREDNSFIQNMEISKLTVSSSEKLFSNGSMSSPTNLTGMKNKPDAMRSVTFLSFACSSDSDYTDDFLPSIFRVLRFWSCVIFLYGMETIQLPDCCEAVNIRFDYLENIANCQSIKYLALDGMLDVDEFYFTSEILESLKFSLTALNLNILKRVDDDCGEIAVELQRLLEHQVNLKILSVNLFDDQPRYIKEIFDSCRKDIVKFIKRKRQDMDLFIFGDKLAVVNKNLSRETIRTIDNFDSEYGWHFRALEDGSTVRLDPAEADLVLPLR